MEEELREHLTRLQENLHVEIDLHGSRSDMAKNLRVAILETESEIKDLGYGV